VRDAAVLKEPACAPRVLQLRGAELHCVPRHLPTNDACVSILVRPQPVIVRIIHAVCAARRASEQARGRCA
jgi:hypothetical protein